MSRKYNFRYDPLYRVVDETEEMRIVEGNFKPLFDRLKRINNLGIIPEIFEMAKYPKYEHALGTVYQVNNLLEVVSENIIPYKYRKPLVLAALFLHLGHFPYTYSTERALLLASNLGDRSENNKIKKYIIKKANYILNKLNITNGEKNKILDKLFKIKDYKLLYKLFSAEILVRNWGTLKKKLDGLDDGDLETIIRDLIDAENDGYKYLQIADTADYVQRDALYFGTVRIDISPKHLYGGIKYKSNFSISEEKLIEYNKFYISERFYNDPDIIWFSRLYEKIVASLILSEKFELEWLEKYDDSQFKRLICNRLDKENNKTNLPATWVERAKKLFEGDIGFVSIFDLKDVLFPKEKDVIDVEYALIGKRESERGLLKYPFDKGILLVVDYSTNPRYPIHPNYQAFSIRVFQDESKRSLTELLKIIKNVSSLLSFSNVKNIREGLANEFSWTKKARISNEAIIYAISDAIKSIEADEYGKGGFIEKFLKTISNISTFGELWHNFENQYVWMSFIQHFLKHNREDLESGKIYEKFTEGLLSLPTRLLQYNSTKKYLDEIYDKLLEKISSPDVPNDKKGDMFEALWLIHSMRTKKGDFQLFLSGMVVVDPDKPANKQDDNEFDIIELLINRDGEAECWIYMCSIAKDYRSENREQIFSLAEQIHSKFPDLIIRSRYIVPKDKNSGNWEPREEDTGINYNLE